MDYYIGKFLSEVRYNIEGMTATHWCILGLMSVMLGMMYLRSSKNGR